MPGTKVFFSIQLAGRRDELIEMRLLRYGLMASPPDRPSDDELLLVSCGGGRLACERLK
jgi:hypothetical protein